ncbi:MAG: enoyl-CoA hydratase/isomerase family protein [Clostridiales Family XIII bacterium]|jgi:2-(1,2-epoxy-1,2-dihydrophenyl)acetyl-CoA isomerase|nr:enoyl-CoA hydratase/isomerase family protein [Clostridiales Family XIII bacterium]
MMLNSLNPSSGADSSSCSDSDSSLNSGLNSDLNSADSDEAEVLLNRKDDIAVIALNRPKVGNCINRDLADGLVKALSQAAGDASVRVVILKGNGRFFCTGGDIPRLTALTDNAARYDEINNTGKAIQLIVSMPKPVICMVHGMVAGAGFGFALASDFVVSEKNTKFMSAFSKIGLVSDCATAFNLANLVGKQRAKEFLMLSEPIKAEYMYQLGLINRLTDEADLERETYKIAEKLLSMPPLSLRLTKEFVNNCDGMSLKQAIAWEESAQTMCLGTEDFIEGTSAFLEKRPPLFHGK